jgi:hypothetical protein
MQPLFITRTGSYSALTWQLFDTTRKDACSEFRVEAAKKATDGGTTLAGIKHQNPEEKKIPMSYRLKPTR